MATTKNRFSLVLQLSGEAMSSSSSPKGGPTRGVPSPSFSIKALSSTSSSTSSIALKQESGKKGAHAACSQTSPSCTHNNTSAEERGGDRSSLLHKVSRVLGRSSKVDVPSLTRTTFDNGRGIDYAHFHQRTMADDDLGKSPSTSSFLLPSPRENTLPPRPTTSPGHENKRPSFRRSLSQSALVDTSLGQPFYAKIDSESPSEPTFRISDKQRPIRDSNRPGQRLKKAKRRKSLLDLAQFSRSSTPTTIFPTKVHAPQNEAASSLKRSASLWNRPGHVSSESVSSTNEAFQSRYRQNFGIGSPLREKVTSQRQRSLNVKRAKKMAQVFGDEPPQELFQIVVQDDDEDENESDFYRHSMASSFSLSSAFLLSHPRNHNVQVVKDDEPPEPVNSEPTPPSRRPRLETDLPIETHPAPPFSSYFHDSEDANSDTESTTDDHPSPRFNAEFHERRKRVAKLSKFFGVGYHEFTNSLPPPLPTQAATAHVDVRVNNRGWFWESHRDKAKPVNVSEVIGKLRELR